MSSTPVQNSSHFQNGSQGTQQAHSSTDKQNPYQDKLPSVAIAMHDILNSADVDNYELRIIEQLLEVSHKYTSDVMKDAKIYQRHTRAPKLEPFHLNYAVESLINHSVTKPPKVDTLLDVAKECNGKNQFLLESNKDSGVVLPPERYCLTKQNYQMEKRKRQRRE